MGRNHIPIVITLQFILMSGFVIGSGSGSGGGGGDEDGGGDRGDTQQLLHF